MTKQRINSQPPKGNFIKAVSAVVWKDLQAEFRSRELFSAMLVFSLLIILIFNFALELFLGMHHGSANRRTVDLFEFVNTVQGFAHVDTPCLTFEVTDGAFCQDRDDYLFWDAIHPTKKAHAILAEVAYGALPATN